MAAQFAMEFIELTHLVLWSNGTLKTPFWLRVNDHLFCQVPVTATTCSLPQYINHVLWLGGISLIVGEVDENTTTTHPPSPLCMFAHEFVPVSAPAPESILVLVPAPECTQMSAPAEFTNIINRSQESCPIPDF